MDKTIKIDLTFSQIWLSVIDKIYYEVTFVYRVFSICYELTHKFETLRKRKSSAAMCNSRIAKSFLG